MNSRYYNASEINLDNKLMEQKVKVFVYIKPSKIPMIMSYRTELDVSLLLNLKEAPEYQQLIRIARWII